MTWEDIVKERKNPYGEKGFDYAGGQYDEALNRIDKLGEFTIEELIQHIGKFDKDIRPYTKDIIDGDALTQLLNYLLTFYENASDYEQRGN
tara:strand:- start:323 stop:595 length:273 start_codon:yes stop_codon:yes gene_type:complete